MRRVQPFGRLTEFMQWHENNCAKCLKYENESTERSRAKCKMAFDLDFATVSDGTIPIRTANRIGYHLMSLHQECKELKIENQ